MTDFFDALKVRAQMFVSRFVPGRWRDEREEAEAFQKLLEQDLASGAMERTMPDGYEQARIGEWYAQRKAFRDAGLS